ncbi:MAG: hypothetical protein U0169_08230 [Polyangiaceae bacterium]
MKSLLRWMSGSACVVACAVVVACGSSEVPSDPVPARTDPEPTETRSLEEALVADLQDPSSAFYADPSKHAALLDKAMKETPGLRERLETISKTLASSHGVSGANPRLTTSAEVPSVHAMDLGAAAPKAAGPRCAAAVGFAAAYAYAWACRQCASGETVCAYAYAYAYAYAFAWVCLQEKECGDGKGGTVDGGANDAAPADAATGDATPADASSPDVLTADVLVPDATPAEDRDADADAKIDMSDAMPPGDSGMR